jgi:hypothetical protein
MRVLPILVVSAVVGAIAVPAHAQAAGRYAVVAFEVAGDADPHLRDQVQGGLARGVAEAGGTVVGDDEVQKQLAGKPALIGCLSTTCLVSIAEVVGTTQLLRLRIAATGANYELALELLDTTGPVRRRGGTCTVCTVGDLADLTATRVHELLVATASAPLPVEIATRPAGVTLEIPGVGSETGPWSGGLAAGTHVVEAHKPGYRRARHEITVLDDGREQRFEITLLPEADPAEGRPGWIKWATGGAALGALVSGGVLLGLHGNQTCDAADASCPRAYDTLAPGLVIGLVGLAGAGVAGWMFWSEHRGREQAATVLPTRGGAMATFQMTF